MDLERLYHKAPIWVQNSLVSISGLRIQRRRYNGAFDDLLSEYESRLKWTGEEIGRFRDERIHAFVMHCEEHVPYYRNLFRDLKISAKDIRGLSHLKVLPLLHKNTVQERYNEFLAENIPPSQRVIAHTSGTTGGGLRFATTHRALSEQWAVWWRYRRLHGLDKNVWCGYFGGRSVVSLEQQSPPFWRLNYPGRQIMFSGYHMNPKNMRAYVAELRKRCPPWLHGYPSLLALLSAYMLDNHLSLGYPVRWITIGAENLLQQQAELIQRALGVRPLQHYGMAEAVANISQDLNGALRVDEDFAAVEFIPNQSGPGYKIVGTNLSNPATPLLRYDTADLAELPENSEDELSWGRTVVRLDGRQEDYIVLRNGAKLGRMDHVFKDLVRISEAQLLQTVPGEVVVRVVRGEGYTKADEERLLEEFRKRVGDLASLNIEYVSSIPRTGTGKLRFVVSEIHHGKLAASNEYTD